MSMDNGVQTWWVLMGAISIFNIGAYFYSSMMLARRKQSTAPEIYRTRRRLFWLSGIYVLVCAFRSILPRIDLERVCLVETWLSSMLLGRSLATVAELCFIIQCAILLHEAGIATRSRTVIYSYRIIVPLIVIAEAFSWYAILSKNYLGSVIEESLWTVAGALLLLCFFMLWPFANRLQRYFLSVMVIYGVGFVIFMLSVDVPMYWSRWLIDSAENITYLSLTEGIHDMLKSCNVSFDWAVWREEIPWMTLYFSVTVWISMAMAHAPDFRTMHSRYS